MTGMLSRRDIMRMGITMFPASTLHPLGALAHSDNPAAKRIELVAADGHKFSALRVDPVGPSKGGVVILHAVYGLTTNMSDVCARWAQAGYTAIAPALFDRIKPDTVHPYTREGVLAGTDGYKRLTEEQIFADIIACVASAGGEARTAISGFCTGGSWAWRASAKLTFVAHVNLYGSHVFTSEYIDLKPLCPTIIHYGDKDAVVSLPETERIRAKHPAIEMMIYPGAGHAFLNPDQQSYHAESAQPAWTRSIAFLDQHLGSKKG